MSSRSNWKQNVIGWVFAAPWTLIFLLFLLGPIVASLILSFTDFGLVNLANPFKLHFIGIQNYLRLFRDPLFLTAAFNTLYFVVVGVPLNVVLSLLLALGVNQGVSYLKSLFRVGYYLPVVTSIVALAVIWRYIYNPDVGLLNSFLHLFGLPGADWLGNPNLAMPAIIIMSVWHNMGSAMIIFLAGLQGIDKSLYEAANIDGAGIWGQFRSITLPLLRPVLLFVTVVTSIGFLQVFAEPFVMTNGGPLNRTLTVSIYLYQQGFSFFHQGYASAMAYVMFIAIVLFALVQFRLLRPQT
ncbi:sugar ABC transporter permease [Ktedonosporobacter rubrisoli]|uniref:Sugar ABC transporter permease n=2 Tax=Ktedonosporobacter rubrisoli TaxID=2509675 RepID=A0A4P6K5Q3_KTERU|nr:sugar ABC transporter permease [Ktedonosporobacter rubrisoli]